MVLNGGVAQPELTGDLFVLQSASDQGGDLTLPRGQRSLGREWEPAAVKLAKRLKRRAAIRGGQASSPLTARSTAPTRILDRAVSRDIAANSRLRACQYVGLDLRDRESDHP